MKDISRSIVFDTWLKKLKDSRAKIKILTRIDRLAEGNPGDHRFLDDISEMRIDYGTGYRVYYIEIEKRLIILLCGGDKTTQQADIKKARKIAKQY
jgi:putative addiction module killer protein